MILHSPLLPFFVPPYPDEILGSWLWRLQVHNHASLLWQMSGLSTPRHLDGSEWRDIAKRSPELVQLLGALGTTYEEAMMALTTYPYWLRFHSEHLFNWPGDTTGLPALILKYRRKSLSRVRYLTPNLVRVCPHCLAEDFEQYGEPYLHRAHLLPFVSVCYKHRMPLVSSCPVCHQIFRMCSTFIRARLTCECGYDLRTPVLLTGHSETWERLACYSADALFDTDTFHECNTFYRFLDSRLATHAVERRPDLMEHLAHAYGDEPAKAMLSLERQGSDAYSYSPIGWISRRELRAPQICALLASIDLNFADSQTQFQRFRETSEISGVKSFRNTRRPRIPQSVAEARSFALDAQETAGRKSITRSFLYRRHKTLFWYLVLFDCEWFDANFPPGGRGAPKNLPSIESDRTDILLAISKASRLRVTIWTNLAQQACFRASLRDTEWLEGRKKETTRAAKEKKLAQRQEYLEACVAEVKRTMERIRAVKGIHVSISPLELAPYSKLNQSQLRHLFADNPEMRRQLVRDLASAPCTMASSDDKQ